MEYWMEEPWGAWRDNMHAGIVASAVLMPHQEERKRSKPEDFMLVDRDTLKRRSLAQLAADLEQTTARKPKAKKK
jgi:hypothetical protein